MDVHRCLGLSKAWVAVDAGEWEALENGSREWEALENGSPPEKAEGMSLAVFKV